MRYADDFVVGFQHKQDAERFLRDLKERLGRFELELHPDKTRLIEFGRFATENRQRRGLGKPETLDFLGFTHYCAKDRKGRFQLGHKPVSKRMARTLKRIKEELRRRMHVDRRGILGLTQIWCSHRPLTPDASKGRSDRRSEGPPAPDVQSRRP